MSACGRLKKKLLGGIPRKGFDDVREMIFDLPFRDAEQLS